MRKFAIAAAMVAAAAASPALAAGATGNQTTGQVKVSLQVDVACAITTYGLDFGTKTTITGATAQSNTTVQCTPGAAYTVLVNSGTNPLLTQRRMTSGSSTIDYGVYTDDQFSSAWPLLGVSKSGDGTAQAVTLYGKVTQAGSVAAGSYADTLVVTVDY